MSILFRFLLVVSLSIGSVLTTQSISLAASPAAHHLNAVMSCSVPCQTNVPKKDELDSDTIEGQDDTPDVDGDTIQLAGFYYHDSRDAIRSLSHGHSYSLGSTTRVETFDDIKIHVLHAVFRI